MSGGNPQTLKQIVFQTKMSDGVNGELAISSALSLSVGFTLPGGRSGAILASVAVALFATTLVRFFSDMGRFSDARSIIKRTNRLTEFLSLVCLVQILYFVVQWSDAALQTSYNPVVALFVCSFLFVAFFVVFIEFAFRNYLIWWGSVLYTHAHSEAETLRDLDTQLSYPRLVLYNLLAQMAYEVLDGAIPEEDDEEWVQLREFMSNIESVSGSDDGPELNKFRLIVLLGLALAAIVGTITYVISLVSGSPLETGLLMVSLIFLRHTIGFSHIAFGAFELEDYLYQNKQFVVYYPLYSIVVYLLVL